MMKVTTVLSLSTINIMHVMRSQKWEPLAPIFTIFFN